MSVKFTSLYRAEIFFETDDEETVEHELRIKSRTWPGEPDDADWNFTPGSPASSPYITVEGLSKARVKTLANKIHAELKKLNVEFVE